MDGIFLAKKRQGTNCSGRGEKSLPFDPGSELRLAGREKRREKIIHGIKRTFVNPQHHVPYTSTQWGHGVFAYFLRQTSTVFSFHFLILASIADIVSHVQAKNGERVS